jgi:hypothetical protein
MGFQDSQGYTETLFQKTKTSSCSYLFSRPGTIQALNEYKSIFVKSGPSIGNTGSDRAEEVKYSLKVLFFFFLAFRDRVSLCSLGLPNLLSRPGWPQT